MLVALDCVRYIVNFMVCQCSHVTKDLLLVRRIATGDVACHESGTRLGCADDVLMKYMHDARAIYN